MDQTDSELPGGDPVSDALQFFDALRLAIKDNQQLLFFDALRQTIKGNPQLAKKVLEIRDELAALIPPADPTPRQTMRTVVDNSTPDSMEINPIMPKDVHGPSFDESGCSAGEGALPPLQAGRWPLLSPMVSPTPMNGRNKSALVIEYDKSLSRMFTAFLKSDHYLVRTAYESEDALRLYRDCGPFEVVLVDYRMPKKNGIDIALDILKQDPTQPMIIVASEYRSEDEVPRRNELMNIPFLLEMSNSRFRTVLEKLQPWATREEVDRAITALTTAQLSRLQRYGDARVRFSRGADYRTGDDLLQEAVRVTLEGKEGGGSGRRWNKRVTLEKYLYGAIRSLTRRRKSDLEWATVNRDAEGRESSPLDNVASGELGAEKRLLTEEKINRILRIFKDDPEAMWVLQGWSEGMKRNEIMQEGLSENQYRATVKRIRMKLLSPTNGGGGGEKHDGQD